MATILPGSSIWYMHMFSNLPQSYELYSQAECLKVYCWEKEAGSVLYLKVVLPCFQVRIPRQPAAPA